MKLYSERFSLPTFPRHLIAVAAFALCSGYAHAADPFTVKDIRVEGIQRTEAGTVFSYLPVRVGETFTDEKGATAIKALYATGFFKDVRIEVEGDVLVVFVEERPAIAAVEFTGTKEFDKEQLTKALKEIGVGESRIFDKALVDRAEQELKRQYLSRGLYSVVITTTVTPIERNRVSITFAVEEGDVSRIKNINIIGSKAFSEKELIKNMSLSTPGWFTWYSKADQYSKQKLAGDIEKMKSFYLDRGYIEMQIESTQVSISPDKKDIYITVNIKEGEKYSVSDIKLEGEMFGREEELKSLLQLKKGDVYSGEKLTASTKNISERLGNFGYAFANVNANPQLDRDKKEVAFTILIDPGKRVYVRNINISGNTKTRDEVIRRELRQFENSWYDGEKIKLSRDRVDRLDYFNEVTVETPDVPGKTDQVDVNLAVTEKPTGNIMLGAGFSSSEKLSLSGAINQANAFGSGNTVGIDVNTSKLNRTIALSSTNPYFTDDGISRSYEVFTRTTRPPTINTGDYRIRTNGANVKFGVPFSEYDRVFFGIGIEQTDLETYTNTNGTVTNNTTSPDAYRRYVDNINGVARKDDPRSAFQEGQHDASATALPLTAAWQRDNRDSALVPTKGRYQRANFEISPAGDSNYFRATYQQQWFRPLFSSTTLALNGEVNYGKALGGKVYPIFKNFYAGGIGSVRGYESSSLGPKDEITGDPLGGSSRLIFNAELQFPFPGSGIDRSLRWFTFFDAGNVYKDGFGGDLKTSVGIGLSWISPIGPLKLSFGKALNADDSADVTKRDKTQAFQFQLGTGF
ncbi:outer membrane protein assembly factor BamA [Herminiimonas fonticola]|uniref:Outer membrane protein assembly factor BamA n=1 Tax=Herminiimonas fonticola TaxID=303380 RepID=A0A4R6G6S1_9BURK|nr:outer membrane protein assembly factor BamA [Herminiimonas fonticola]RBA24192.1 outer membrane protein assembly complex, YaeT protein [Herminiimonas fonticola]TDN90193.1 Beta-barrel assembly machine subunit BamA [Herminiimonas fonticola]